MALAELAKLSPRISSGIQTYASLALSVTRAVTGAAGRAVSRQAASATAASARVTCRCIRVSRASRRHGPQLLCLVRGGTIAHVVARGPWLADPTRVGASATS